MTFRVGQRVACVKVGAWETDDIGPVPAQMPVYGGVYTIDEIVPDDDGTWLRLDGFDCFALWHARHFRPVVERKTDISLFTAMLNPSQVTVDAG